MNAIICRYGEIHLKGGNRGFFVRALKNNIVRKLKKYGCSVDIEDTRVVIGNFDDNKSDEIVARLQTVFGLTSISVGERISYNTPDDILDYIKKISVSGEFKVEVNRADKSFPIKSPAFAALCGDAILKNNGADSPKWDNVCPTVPSGIILKNNGADRIGNRHILCGDAILKSDILKNNGGAVVNVTNPKTIISVDIRQSGVALIFSNTVKGLGGLPVGVSGRALCLLSGGIDSPVAAYLAMKRGLCVDFIHFASPPYTSEQSLDKVKTLCKQVCKYGGGANLYVVPFTEIQRDIRAKTREEFMITIMRRYMVAIAEKVGLANHCDCIITGENLAQVASQTIQGITTNNFVATKLPILRPLICFDKCEIIDFAKQIGTYETSILPFADCCTVFVPKHPAITPKIDETIRECEKLDFANLADSAYSGICKSHIICDE
ncbi:MAG: tRNA 4-thiouridine(8) synthase ThiI [Christensenellaceae bacterium]|jgi:thiamine biosynthesis protein ThiI|nr:tRNA 4-thiouridine(8) synthase ThiI [Christensenellaceae bacterium]